MLIGKLAVGDQVGHGVYVWMNKRDGNYRKIILSNGTEITVHKTTHVADLMIGHMPARSTRTTSAPPMIGKVRASDPEWRGENVGQRGERRIARNSSHDARAVAERRNRIGR